MFGVAGEKFWRARLQALLGDNDEDEDEDEDEDGVEVFTVSSRQCSRTGADLSPPPPSIPRYLVEPYRHAAAKMRGRACLPVTV